MAAMTQGTPAADIEISADLVRALVTAQHPDLPSDLIRSVGSGWDNAMFWLGSSAEGDVDGGAAVVRFPRRKAAADLIRHEQRWLPQLAPQLTLPVPVPIRTGNPSESYPWHWSVLPWIAGETADAVSLKREEAGRLGAFLRSLHTLAPENAPHNPFRGIPLQMRSRQTQPILQQLQTETSFITPRIEQLWQDALSAPVSIEKRWLHGDLHPRNILVKDGAISGIIDWGDITSGDVATDLSAVWMLFSDVDAQRLAFAHYGASDVEIVRSKGWAIAFAAFLLQTGLVDNPRNAAIGARILRHLQGQER